MKRYGRCVKDLHFHNTCTAALTDYFTDIKSYCMIPRRVLLETDFTALLGSPCGVGRRATIAVLVICAGINDMESKNGLSAYVD